MLIFSTIESLPIDNGALQDWFSAPAEIRAGVSHNSAWQEEWKLENIELNHPNLALRSDLGFSQEASRLNGHYNLSLRNIEQAAAIFGVEAHGDELLVNGELSQTSSEIIGTTQATLGALTVAGTDLKEIDLKLNLQRDGGPLIGTLAGSLNGPLGPTDVAATISRADVSGDLNIENAKITAGKNNVTGNLQLNGDGSPVSGKLDGELTSVRELSAMFGQRFAGNLTFTSLLTNLDAAPQVEVRAEGSRLSGDVPGFGVVSSRALSFIANSETSTADNRVQFELNGADVDRDRIHFDELRISGTTNGEDTKFDVNGAGFFEGELNVQASGSVERQSDTVIVALKNVSALVQGDRWTLNQEVRVERDLSRTSITPFALTSGARRIGVDATMTDRALSAKINANDVPLQLVALISPRYALGGSMNGTADLNARPGASSGTLDLEIKNLRPRGIVGDTESLTGSIKGDWNGTQLKLQGRLKGQQDGVIDLTAAVPFTYTADGFATPGDQPLSGNFEWRADIAPLWQIIQPDLHTLSGAVNADIALAGTIDKPQLTGSFVLRNGTYRHLEFGTVLNELAVDVDLENQVLMIRQGKGKTSNGGSVGLDGRIQVDPARQFPARIAFNFDNAELVRRDDIKGSASGSFVYERNGTAASFTGNIKSDTIEAKLVGGLPANVVDLEVIEVGGARLPEQSSEQDIASTEFEKTKLEVNVSVSGQAFVRGRGLDSEWAGNLRIKGTLATPIITGQLRVVRGRFDFASRAFDLDGGTLTFEGTEKIDPRLNLQATYEDDDFTAATRVSGPSSKPTVTLSSSPSLPDDEILARILFGNSVSELSPLEALQLAEAARSLSSGGSGGVGGFIGATRDTLGLDTLRIGAAADEAIQPSITGGKYLT